MSVDVSLFVKKLTVKTLFITEVDYNKDKNTEHEYIEHVRVEYISGDEQQTSILSRKSVVVLLKHNLDIFTSGINRGQPQIARVAIYTLNGEEYIRTVSNSHPWDNLGNLPSITR